ncbi:MAG TPA: hypothetical protein VG538_10350 [Vicinamibacterales bacterium]|nr:hypothetical protein [Vicinamibacterales bacterium]
MSRRATTAVALFLAPVLAVSTLATCMAAPATAPRMQMACCSHGHDHCPMHEADAGSAADCCHDGGVRHEQLNVAEQQPVATMSLALQPGAMLVPREAMPPLTTGRVRGPYADRSTSPPSPALSRSTVLLI